MKIVKIPVFKTSTGYDYPISMDDVEVLYYLNDYSYAVIKVRDDQTLPEEADEVKVDIPKYEVVPGSITPRQGYIILSRYGLLAPVKTYFAALEGQEGEEAQIELEFAQEWKRSWPTLINAAHAFGLTDAQIDQMFIEASVI